MPQRMPTGPTRATCAQGSGVECPEQCPEHKTGLEARLTAGQCVDHNARMDPLDLRDDLRKFLQTDAVNLSEIERTTTLTRSWLSKFKNGEIDNPTVQQLNALHRYRQSAQGPQT